MFSIKRTEEFDDWLSGICDGMTQLRLVARLRKAALGGGAKSTQAADIAKAVKLAATIEE